MQIFAVVFSALFCFMNKCLVMFRYVCRMRIRSLID